MNGKLFLNVNKQCVYQKKASHSNGQKANVITTFQNISLSFIYFVI